MHEALSLAGESRQVLPKHNALLHWLEEKLVASLQICLMISAILIKTVQIHFFKSPGKAAVVFCC